MGGFCFPALPALPVCSRKDKLTGNCSEQEQRCYQLVWRYLVAYQEEGFPFFPPFIFCVQELFV